MSEFEKLRALLDVAPAKRRSMPNTAPQEPKASRPSAARRWQQWLFGILFAGLALDALYLLVTNAIRILE